MAHYAVISVVSEEEERLCHVGLRQQPSEHQRAQVRIYRTRVSLFGLLDDEVRQRFHLPPHIILETLEIVQIDLGARLSNHTSISPLTKLLAVLQFTVSGSFQKVMGCTMGMSQSSFSRNLKEVLRSFLLRFNQFIDMPLDEEALVQVTQHFNVIAGFPHVIRVVDGTHIALVPRGVDANIFMNRKSFSSLNVQIVCDANLLIQNIVAKFPGSSLNAFVMQQSALWHRLIERQTQVSGDAWILDKKL